MYIWLLLIWSLNRNSASESIKQKLVFVGSEEGKLIALRQTFEEVHLDVHNIPNDYFAFALSSEYFKEKMVKNSQECKLLPSIESYAICTKAESKNLTKYAFRHPLCFLKRY